MSTRPNHTATDIQNRLGRIENEVSRSLNLLTVRLGHRLVARKFDLWRPAELKLAHLGILGDVNQNRAGTTGTSDFVGGHDGRRNVFSASDEEAVLSDRHGDTHDVRLLEGVRANRVRVDLTGDSQHRYRIHVCIRDGCDQVGRARPRGCNANADSTGGGRVTLGRVTGSLLVTHQDVTDFLRIHQRVVGWQNRTAGKTKDGIHTDQLEAADDGLSAGQNFAGHLVRSSFWRH